MYREGPSSPLRVRWWPRPLKRNWSSRTPDPFQHPRFEMLAPPQPAWLAPLLLDAQAHARRPAPPQPQRPRSPRPGAERGGAGRPGRSSLPAASEAEPGRRGAGESCLPGRGDAALRASRQLPVRGQTDGRLSLPGGQRRGPRRSGGGGVVPARGLGKEGAAGRRPVGRGGTRITVPYPGSGLPGAALGRVRLPSGGMLRSPWGSPPPAAPSPWQSRLHFFLSAETRRVLSPAALQSQRGSGQPL